MKTTAILAMASLSLLAGCNGAATGGPPVLGSTGGASAGTGGAGTGTSGISTTGTGGVGTGTGGTSTGTGPGGAGTGTGGVSAGTGTGGSVAGTGGASVVAVTSDQAFCGAVSLPGGMTIAAGRTATICAGSTVTLGGSANIEVLGTLLVQGTATGLVKFVGVTHTAGAWGGFVLQAGGSIVATFIEVHDASYAFNARAGSSFQIDHVLMDNSMQLTQLSTNGTLSHGVLHGGGSVIVTNASPTVSDTVLDQGLGSDIVIVSGATSKPVFDHLEVTNAHCAFHFNSGGGATISNSFVHDNAYVLMAEGSTNTVITHNNFVANQINIGTCASTASAQVTANYFGGLPPFNDGTCTSLVATGSTTAPYTTDVGPRP